MGLHCLSLPVRYIPGRRQALLFIVHCFSFSLSCPYMLCLPFAAAAAAAAAGAYTPQGVVAALWA